MYRSLFILALTILGISSCKKQENLQNNDEPCECAPPGLSAPDFAYRLKDSLGNYYAIPNSYEDSIVVNLIITAQDTVEEAFYLSGQNADSSHLFLSYDNLRYHHRHSLINEYHYQFVTPFGTSHLIDLYTNPGYSGGCCSYPYIDLMIDETDTLYQAYNYPYSGYIDVVVY